MSETQTPMDFKPLHTDTVLGLVRGWAYEAERGNHDRAVHLGAGILELDERLRAGRPLPVEWQTEDVRPTEAAPVRVSKGSGKHDCCACCDYYGYPQ